MAVHSFFAGVKTDLPLAGKTLKVSAYMEDNIESSGTSMVPLALALLAIVLGGAGLYFGLNANQRIAPMAESLDEGDSSVARLKKQLSQLDTRVRELSVQNDQLKQTLQRLGRESTQALRIAKQAGGSIESNRNELIQLAEKLKELVRPGVNSSAAIEPAVAEPSVGDDAAMTASSAASDDATTYQVQAGDTLGKIARRNEVKLDALIDANPGIDPRRLRIGQELQVPGN